MIPPPKVWRQGDRCRITFNGRTVPGTIVFGSGNGVSLMLEFEALLVGPMGGAYAGRMAVLWEEDGFFDLIERAEVGLAEPAN